MTHNYPAPDQTGSQQQHQMMKAWIATAYGGPEVLALKDVARPVAGPGEIVIRVEATTVSSGDRRLRSMDMPKGMRLLGRAIFGFSRPRQPILGAELTGIVSSTGTGVTRFSPGDAVIAMTGGKGGAHAGFVRIKADGPVVRRPADMPLDVAASLCFGGTTALSFLDRAALKAGETMLVIGASGTVGSAFVQIAVAKGAIVTAVTSGPNVALASGLGASRVIYYKQQDPGSLPDRFDVIADTTGTRSFAESLHLLAAGGRFLAIAGGLDDMLARAKGGKTCIAGPASEKATDLARLVDLWQGGRYTPLVDSKLGFDALKTAHALADTGRKRGSIVILLD